MAYFSAKPYLEVNREERFFCALLAHALLASRKTRSSFVRLLHERCGVTLDSNDLQVFVEAAVLRDYWHDLGNRLAYSDKLDAQRLAVVEASLASEGLPVDLMTHFAFFRTTAAQPKVWYPGRWNLRSATGTEYVRGLQRIKWSFNAKPDLLLISPTAALVIEAKLESGEGRDAELGYEQFDVQHKVISLWKTLIPSFGPLHIERCALELRPRAGLSWRDVRAVLAVDELDAYSVACFDQLQRYK